jgi:NAD(P)-dependent dehydrogenase (short-subunit alcohol dehydrogenase family)
MPLNERSLVHTMQGVRFAGQTAIVTGAGRGMGRAVALALAREGAAVVVGEVDRASADHVVGEIEAGGGRALAVTADIASVDDVRGLFKETVAAFGGLDILVNNAGIGIPKPLVDYTEQDWDRQLGVNLKGMFFATQEAAKLMIPKRKGKIVNFASTAAFVSSSTPEAAYDISKGGVRQLTISVAAELAPHNINVNAVAPGTIMTELTLRVLDTEEKMARASAKIPLGRLGTPEDMVGPVLFLCSSDADYVTGHVLVVDGGWLLF